jgi:hypothetical protein
MSEHRFPPRWSVEEQPARLVVRDLNIAKVPTFGMRFLKARRRSSLRANCGYSLPVPFARFVGHA